MLCDELAYGELDRNIVIVDGYTVCEFFDEYLEGKCEIDPDIFEEFCDYVNEHGTADYIYNNLNEWLHNDWKRFKKERSE